MKPTPHRGMTWMLLLLTLGLAGCNTVSGFGKDVQKVGDLDFPPNSPITVPDGHG